MPTGSIPLLEAAKCGDDMLKRGFVEVLIRESGILERIPWMTISGNALKQYVEENLPAGQFRDVNETYSRTWGTDSERFWGVTIYGAEVFVDNFLLKTVSNVHNIKAKQYAKHAKSNAMTFDKNFFDGTGTAKDFKGVNVLIAEALGQSYEVATNGAALALSDLDKAHDLMRGRHEAEAILCNRFHRRKITTLAHTTHSGFSLIDIGTDSFGRKVTQWAGIPLAIVGQDATGAEILAFDETQGSSNVASSLYFVNFSEDGVCGLLGAGGSFEVKDFGETQAAPGHLGRYEWYPGLAVFDHYSVVRVQGILES